MTWYMLVFSSDRENEYFKCDESQAIEAFDSDENAMELWACYDNETLSPKELVKS